MRSQSMSNLHLRIDSKHEELFTKYITKAEPVGDDGVEIVVHEVKSWDKDDYNRLTVHFADGNSVEIPYGDVRGGYDPKAEPTARGEVTEA